MLVDINCPVELLNYQLYRSKKTGKVYCSLKFNNISEKSIKGLNATIYCFDQFGEPVGWESNSFEYKLHLTESIGPKQAFDDKEKIALDSFSHARSIDVVFEKVLFSDETIWMKTETELEKVELKQISNPDQLMFVKEHEGNDAKYYSQSMNDKWTCVCGRLNLESMKICKRCEREKDYILSIYSNEKAICENIKLYENQIEEDKKQKLLEKEHQHEIFKKKVKKIVKYSSVLISFLFLIGIATYGFITKFTFSWDNYLLLKDKDNALIEAVKNQNSNDINFLIENGANANFVNRDGENSISTAIELPNKKLAISLMNKGMGSIRVGKEEDSLAHVAVKNEQYEILKELHKFEVDMNLKNRKGHTVLYSAMETGNREILKYLIYELKINLQEVDNEGNNIVQVALLQQLNDTALIKDLLNLDIDLKKKNKEGQNTYTTAILSQNQAIVQLFIDKGLDLNKVDELGNNAVHIYLNYKKDNLTYLADLIEKGTSVNGINEQGQTPLYLAILNGDKKTVEELVKNNADINIVNSNNESAQDIAEKYNKSLVELFEQDRFYIKLDKQKNSFIVSGVSLGSSRRDVVNMLGNPAQRKQFEAIDGEIDCNIYNLKDSTGKDIETHYCSYIGISDKIENISFNFYPNQLNEKWYKDLGKPFIDDDAPLFYLKGTEQLLLLKPNEGIGFLNYAGYEFY
ncbi:Ribulose-5-phosphate 4-epimerase and related epimerases and aldolases [Lysinibacillus capsici]|uniref:Ribulose-5-phosphate 4-epimerase and related epimerases and aldolases n=1 Tax=Lysinibacillus capsici TaxID=2115968 RepID=A0A2X1A4S7_9BACI|nr:ankyrin repeat domain-containing protein [Lysinibacillus capsici]SPU38450.1 Ribulose-5-phosphate 4-epimerase and related epimerases and aldolases [Lysinibacillus capsici]